MRILQLLSSTGYHGSESMAAELVQQLHELGVTVDIGVLDNSGRGDQHILEVAAPYFRHGVVVPCNGQLDLKTIRMLRRYVSEHRIDIVHSHKYKTTFYGLMACRGQACRVIATYHNWLDDTPALRMYSVLDKYLARYCDAVVGVSKPVTQELRRHARPERIFQISNGVDIDLYRRAIPLADAKRALDLPNDSLVVGFVGRLSAQKGVAYLLRALADLPDIVRRQTYAVIAGDGEHRAVLSEEVHMLGIADHVRFLGTRRDTPAIYSAMDLFVLPSEVEAFPMVIIEAMASGVPVVASDVGDVRRIIEHGITGFVVTPRDVKDLREKICLLLSDLTLARRMGEAGRNAVEQYSSLRMARTYLEIYGKVM
jgi:glycosyltransferase involved in cell wall biosynthesis